MHPSIKKVTLTPAGTTAGKDDPKDFDVVDGGSVWIVIPKTEAAEAWVEEHIPEDRIVFGQGFGVEASYVKDLVCGFIDDGLSCHIINR